MHECQDRQTLLGKRDAELDGAEEQKKELGKLENDYVIVSEDLLGKIENAGVVEDFESGPHEAVTFQVV